MLYLADQSYSVSYASYDIIDDPTKAQPWEQLNVDTHNYSYRQISGINRTK